VNLLQLEGKVDTPSAEYLASLEDENRNLKRELAQLRVELSRAKSENGRAIGALRQQLSPLYRALQDVFGEIEAIGGAEETAASSPKASAVWENWKQRVGGQKAKCIDAFLTHGALTQTQLRVIVGCATSSVPGLISDLRQLGLLEKNGSMYSLKKL
jgi:hypothetical protein